MQENGGGVLQPLPPCFLIYASLQLLAAVVAEDPLSAAAD